MERLLIVVQELSLAKTLERIMEIVRVAARELTRSDGACFMLKEGDCCYYADEDAIAPLWKGKRFPMDVCIGGWTMRHRVPAVIANVSQDQRIPWLAYEPTFIQSLVMVPIRTLNPIGAIGTYWAAQQEPAAQDVKVLQALADTTAVAIENVQVHSELEHRVEQRTIQLQITNQKLALEIQERRSAEEAVRLLSLTDELTGLHNRRGFFLLAEQQLKLSTRLKTAFSVLFIDLDGLKQINDLQGHETGDVALWAAANVLKRTFRESDLVARLGGDEFAVLAPGNPEEWDRLQHRLQDGIDQFNQRQEAPFQLSMSVGSYTYETGETRSLEDILALADQQMYEQKRLKRQSTI
ncbi:diguanylate cyclase [Leptolyngbya sp. FACHB-60]